MINNRILAKILQDRLNGELLATGEYSNIAAYWLTSFHTNTRYEFNIAADDADYKKARPGGALATAAVTNTITKYINGVFRTLSGSEIEGTSEDTYNTAVSAYIEMLVPDCDDVQQLTAPDGSVMTIRIQDAVTTLIERALSSPYSEYVPDDDGIIYYVGMRFSHYVPGEKAFRGQASKSMALTVYVSYSLVATGISSRDIGLKIGGEEVYVTRFGIARRSGQEGNIPSNGNGTSQVRTTGSSLTLSFDSPTRLKAIDIAVARYLLLGDITPLEVDVSIPIGRDKEGLMQKLTGTYSMVISDAGLNAELNLAASTTVRLVEEMAVT